MNEQAHARSGIQVIARAAAILRVLRDDTGGLSLGEELLEALNRIGDGHGRSFPLVLLEAEQHR